jgi:hypothetical protein
MDAAGLTGARHAEREDMGDPGGAPSGFDRAVGIGRRLRPPTPRRSWEEWVLWFLLKLEELLLAALSVWLFSLAGLAWWFPALFLAPDLSIVGYAAGPRVGRPRITWYTTKPLR